MRVLITVDPYLPVPPLHYGGIERIVDMLVRGLVARGHAVTLVAHPASATPARLIPYGRPPHVGWPARLGEIGDVGRALWRERRSVDVVHSFGRLAALLPILACRRLPKIQSYQRDGVPWKNVRRAVHLAGPSLVFTGCSSSVFRARPAGDPCWGEWSVIFNGVDTGRYTFQPTVAADAPLVFLGRLEPIKGVHHAIAIARAAARRLVIAGTRVDTGGSAGYFEREIAPHLDGDGIRYAGPVDDADKNALLGRAAAMLMPVDWDEPFGIVMAEAFACGTPVIAFRRGSVPEVVIEGVNGFQCDGVDDAAAAVARLDRIDRRRVRADCEDRFGARVIVGRYEALYSEMIDRLLLSRAPDGPRRSRPAAAC